jgi:hypothetical protein
MLPAWLYVREKLSTGTIIMPAYQLTLIDVSVVSCAFLPVLSAQWDLIRNGRRFLNAICATVIPSVCIFAIQDLWISWTIARFNTLAPEDPH